MINDGDRCLKTNPGLILSRISQYWDGQIGVHGKYVVFASVEYGIRALAISLLEDMDRKKSIKMRSDGRNELYSMIEKIIAKNGFSISDEVISEGLKLAGFRQ